MCLVLAWVLVIACCAAADICYVRPADSFLSRCPGQPCLTLQEYVEMGNFTNGTTLQFLPGIHTLQHSFCLEHISNITFEAAFSHSVIIYKDNATVYFDRVTHLHIIGLSFIFSQGYNGSGLIQFSNCESVFISDTVFRGSRDVPGRAMKVEYSETTIFNCIFKDFAGAIIYSAGTNLTIRDSVFIQNVADGCGGAIFAVESNLVLNKTIFGGNSAQLSGGAISCDNKNCQVQIAGDVIFHNNSCKRSGGAMFLSQSTLNMYGWVNFTLNEAGYGGAISLIASNTRCDGRVTMLKNRARYDGGALYIRHLSNPTFLVSVNNLTLIQNTAGREGGAMYVNGGSVTLQGNVVIVSNTAKIGGGIRANRSHIHVAGDCFIARNNAIYGGAMKTLYGTVSLQGSIKFTHNTAGEDGGAMYAAGSVIQIVDKVVSFSFNSANNGGGMLFENGASLIFSDLHPVNFGPLLSSSFNFASQDGGMIYHKDSPSISQCSYSDMERDDTNSLPDCFLQFQHSYNSVGFPAMVSKNDSAGREGNFMFGGLMDRCKIKNEIATVPSRNQILFQLF